MLETKYQKTVAALVPLFVEDTEIDEAVNKAASHTIALYDAVRLDGNDAMSTKLRSWYNIISEPLNCIGWLQAKRTVRYKTTIVAIKGKWLLAYVENGVVSRIAVATWYAMDADGNHFTFKSGAYRDLDWRLFPVEEVEVDDDEPPQYGRWEK